MKQSSKKNYFFVCTGLQVVNAMEYLYHEKLEDSENILVTYFFYKQVYEEVQMIVNQFPWTKIIHIIPPTLLNIKNEHLRYIATNLYGNVHIRSFRFANSTIIGNDLNPYYRFATRSKKLKKIVFIDDGAGSVHYDGNSPYSGYGIKNKMMYRLLGIKNHIVRPNVFFTAFLLEKFLPKKSENQTIITNSFKYLKSKCQDKERSDIMFFIGDPLVERGYISFEKYVQAITAVQEKFTDKKLIYIPRLTESDHFLHQLEPYVTIQRNKVPFEIFISSLEYFPYALVGYHSSVHFNVRKMYGNSINFYFLRLKDFTTKTHYENTNKILDSLAKFAKEINY
ncbi:hypothetical protein [Flavobacterium aciduliphilum]|uniref:Uncharacterized protein n=1 Tax=Flavobacterium aciduliphilum TaxID=1101402 RepID=A0A328Y8L0_9FLAO|nr:hypothetical protein [Flavobacterium aciduliphilum]RAR70249.1 hypothetical protein CLV55_11174 [Flavobacterium aciduliphilum]